MLSRRVQNVFAAQQKSLKKLIKRIKEEIMDFPERDKKSKVD